ncbi:MAG: DUF4912 domain-containing protein [Planctomycetes bacterium]|nr:DUF4912 domain-containing protein [Planctomycetota bacterium]
MASSSSNPSSSGSRRKAAGASGRRPKVGAGAESSEARAAPPAGESAPRKKLAPPPIPDRDTVRSIEERLRLLEELPSLVQNPMHFEAGDPDAGPAVDIDAPPEPPALEVPEPKAEPEAAVQEEPKPLAMVDRGLPIPVQYPLDRVVPLVRDPHWIFVYWDLGGGRLERLRFKYSNEVVDQARWVLRVESVRQHQVRDVDVDVRARQWYLKVASGEHFRIVLGFYPPEGDFEPVCKSGEVVTPKDAVSPVANEAWMVEREDLRRLVTAAGANLETFEAPSASMHGMMFRRV